MDILAKEKVAEAARRSRSLNGGGGGGGGSEAGNEGGVSREEVEVGILAAQWSMADAEAEQDYTLCSRLQREIKGLEVIFCFCFCGRWLIVWCVFVWCDGLLSGCSVCDWFVYLSL